MNLTSLVGIISSSQSTTSCRSEIPAWSSNCLVITKALDSLSPLLVGLFLATRKFHIISAMTFRDTCQVVISCRIHPFFVGGAKTRSLGITSHLLAQSFRRLKSATRSSGTNGTSLLMSASKSMPVNLWLRSCSAPPISHKILC
jgi:ribosomal protein L31